MQTFICLLFIGSQHRLRECGLQPIYLVESYGHRGAEGYFGGLPEATLEQAIINTQFIDGFMVKRTCDAEHTLMYLTLMTRFLTKQYQVGVTLVLESEVSSYL